MGRGRDESRFIPPQVGAQLTYGDVITVTICVIGAELCAHVLVCAHVSVCAECEIPTPHL